MLLSESTDTYSIEAPYYGIYLTSSTTDAISGGEVVGGFTTNYYYGAYGRLVETLNPDGSFTKTTYSLGGTVLAMYNGTYSGEGTESPSRSPATPSLTRPTTNTIPWATWC